MESINFSFLFLPAYSPFLNPIENMFSKWKNITRRATPQNENELLSAISNGQHWFWAMTAGIF